MANPKISVIVPVYNSGKYLKDTMESLLNQTYDNLEIILVDDGSVDESPQLCDKFAQEHSNVIVIHQPNGGVSVARNAGIDKATGSFISFCDGDDTVDSDYYEFLYRQMTENNSDIAGCTCLVITEDNSFNNQLSGAKKVWENSDGFIRALFKWQVPMSVCNKLFKREVIGALRFPQGYKTNEDKFFCFMTALNAKRISFEEVGKYRYVRRKGSSSITEFEDKYFDCIRLAEKSLEIIREKKPYMIPEAQGNVLAASLRIYKLMHTRNGMEKYKAEADKIHKYIKAFDAGVAKKHLTKNDYIRFCVARAGKGAFRLFVKFIDKKSA
jgi:glycosyltransferase involved in cell wall biosynthesis